MWNFTLKFIANIFILLLANSRHSIASGDKIANRKEMYFQWITQVLWEKRTENKQIHIYYKVRTSKCNGEKESIVRQAQRGQEVYFRKLFSVVAPMEEILEQKIDCIGILQLQIVPWKCHVSKCESMPQSHSSNQYI